MIRAQAKTPRFGATIAAMRVGSTLFGPSPRISGLQRRRAVGEIGRHFTAEKAVGARI
jgi:hypothetical protein